MSRDKNILVDAAIIPGIDDYSDHDPDCDGRLAIPHGLIGGTVIGFGRPDLDREDAPEGGGLVIDYVPEGETATRRCVFGHTELGIWIEYQGIKP